MKCTIKSPQFKNDKIFEYITQSGDVDENTWIFTFDRSHIVHFHTKEKFFKSKN